LKRFEEVYAFIYVDALPLEYVNPNATPHLFKLMRSGSFHVLKNIPGYSFGIQSTVLSGKLPQDTLHWMPYMFKTDKKVQLVNLLRSVCEYNPLICNDVTKKFLYAFRSKKSRAMGFLYEGLLYVSTFQRAKSAKLLGLPPDHFGKILVFPYYYMNENPFFIALKKYLEENFDIRVHYLGHSLSKNIEGLSTILHKAAETPKLFLLEYIDDLDRIGHGKGVASREWFDVLKLIEAFIYKIYKDLSTVSRRIKVMVFSDHGMCNADEYIDLEGLLVNKLPRESIGYFIDATLAFIRVYKSPLKDLISELLTKKLGNRILIFDVEKDKDTLRKYGIYFANGEYGDIIVQTRPCKEFFPNFYSVTHKLIGLHGFWPTETLQRAFVIEFPMEGSRKYENRIKPSYINELRAHIINSLN
jgi:hypothetical protein